MRSIVRAGLIITSFGLAGFGAARAVRAEGGSRPSILIVKTRDIPFYTPAAQGFADGLKTRGYRQGDRVELNTVALTGNYDLDAKLLRDRLQKRPRLVVTLGTDATRMVAAQNPDVPVLFSMVLDPVRLGVVKSLDSPGGKFTGTTILVSPGKQLEALAQTVPKVRHIGVLYTDKDSTSLAMIQEARQEADRLNLQIIPVPIAEGKPTTRADLDQLKDRAEAIWLIPDPASTGPQALSETMAFAYAQKLPVLGASSSMVKSGALLALSASLEDTGDVTAEMAVRLLEDTGSPADMRVRSPRRTLLAMNLDAARALGLTIPPAMLNLADDVVDTQGKR